MSDESEKNGFLGNRGSAEENVRPGFLKRSDDRNEDKQGVAVSKLSNLEDATTNKSLSGADDDVRELEEDSASGGSFYDASSGSKQSRIKTFFKKRGAIFLIVALVGGGGGVALISSMFQPFALVNNLIENFDSSSYSTAIRFKKILKGAETDKRFKKTEELERIFKQVGIEIEADDGGKIKSYSYETKETGADGAKIRQVVKHEELAGLVDTNPEFASKISKAAELLENQSFYTNKTKSLALKRIGWIRSRFLDFDAEGKTRTTEEFKRTADVQMSIDDETRGNSRYYIEKDIDGDGEDELVEVERRIDENDKEYYTDSEGAIYNSADETVEGETRSGKMKKEDAEQRLRHIASIEGGEVRTNLDLSKLNVDSAASFGCMLNSVATAISTLVIAEQTIDMINMASGYMEAIQKVQAGDGTGASLHSYSNETNKTKNGKGFWNSVSISSLFGGDTKKKSAGVANLENVFTDKDVKNRVLEQGASIGNWKACNYARIGVGVASSLVSVFSFGLNKIVSTVTTMVISGAVGITIAKVLEAMIPVAAKAIATDVIEDMGSTEAGDYTVAGANMFFGKMGQAIGQSAGTVEARADFAYASQEIIADRARYDADNLSPFDVSSKNTFLGSIVNSMTQFAVLNGGVLGANVISAMSNVVTGAVSSILPTTSAMEYLDFATEPGDGDQCPLLDSVGASGTANLCINYTISDTNSFDISYEDAVGYLCDSGDLKCGADNEVLGVTENSELAKYIKLWTIRDTHLGLADGNAVSAIGMTDHPIIDAIINVIPVLGDLLDTLNAGKDLENEEYIFGSAYVVGGDKWTEEKKYIQAFLELDSIYSDLGLTEDSTLASYLEDYYEENPLDESYEGVLARYSGLSKDTVVAMLDYMEYENYLANYDASERYVFGSQEVKTDESSGISFNFENVMGGEVILPSYIIYADVRNRNFTV